MNYKLFFIIILLFSFKLCSSQAWYFISFNNDVSIPDGIVTEPFYSEIQNKDMIKIRAMVIFLATSNKKLEKNVPFTWSKDSTLFSETSWKSKYLTTFFVSGPYENKKIARKTAASEILIKLKNNGNPGYENQVEKRIIELTDEQKKGLKNEKNKVSINK